MENAFDLLHPKIAALAKARFATPTEIQEKAIPLVLAGEDVLAIAPTGWGKMEAAFLPAMSGLLENVEAGNRGGIQFLYITPLRALNRDMLERMQYWAHLLGLSIAVRHGDTKQSERLKQRENPPQVLVTTPESVNTLLISPKIRDALRNVKFVVVDEVHELIDSKRGVQLGLALERLRERVREREKNGENNFQTIGLSATVGDEAKAAQFISPKARTVRVDLQRKIRLEVDYPSKPAKELAQTWKLDAATAARIEKLASLIEESKSVLVFVNTRSMAEALSALLFQVEELRGKVGVHHGSLSRETRIATEQEFKRKATEGEEKKLKAIVCTSSLELGIDVGEINLVVQYHSPRQVTRLLQRVGRSGHRKNLVPRGVVLAVAGMDCVEAAVLAKRAIEPKLERTRLPKNSLDALGHQIAGITLDKCVGENDKLSTEYVYGVFKRASHYETLSMQDFLLVCRQLSGQRLLALSNDFAFVAPSRATKLYYYENLSTIPDLRRYFVKDAGSRRNVATLDEDFVAEYLQVGQVFITRGIPWKVLSVADDEVVVEPGQDYEAAVPDWVGEEIPVDYEVTQEVAELLNKTGRGNLGKWELGRDYACSQQAAAEIIAFAGEQEKSFLPSRQKLFVEESGKTLALHSFAGNEANEAIARCLAFLLSAQLGESVRTRASAYSIAFEFSREYGAKKFEKLVRELDGAGLEKVLLSALPSTQLFRNKFVDVAKRLGFIRRDADLKRIGIRRLVEESAGTPVWKEAMNEVLNDKMDVERAKQVVAWPVEVVSRPELSAISREFLEFHGFRELLSPPEPTKQVLEAFQNNLLGQRTRLACNYCKNTFSVFLREAPEQVKCPHCSSTQATLEEYKKVMDKAGKGEELKADERKKLAEARRVESLIASYGKKALVALATYGVGPENAVRVLSRLRDSEEEFYRDLLETQKQFIATRKFWRA